MASLYEMTVQAQALYEMLQAEEIDEQIFNDTLEALGVNEKIESCCAVIRQLQGDAELFKAEADRIYKKEKTAKNAVNRMKLALLTFLQQSGKDKVKAGVFDVAISTSQAVSITDETKLPPEYLIPQPDKIDKAGIRKALKEGAEISGAVLVTNEGVRIR